MCTSGETPVTGTQVDAAPPKSSRRRLSESGESGEGGGGLDGRWKVSRQKQKKDRGKGGTYIVFSSTVLGRQSVLKRGRGRKRKRWKGGDRETKGRERERETKTGWGSVPLAIAGPPLSGGTLTASPGGRVVGGRGVVSVVDGTRPSCLCQPSPVPQLLRLSD